MNISPAGGWRGQPIPAKPPIPERVITWILCITFLYLAGHGSILIHQAQGNIAGGGMYAGIVNATSSNNHDWSEMLAAYSMLVISAFLARVCTKQDLERANCITAAFNGLVTISARHVSIRSVPCGELPIRCLPFDTVQRRGAG